MPRGAAGPEVAASGAVAATAIDWPVTTVRWRPGWRIVPTRFPTVLLYDRVADPEDFDALYELEAMTNDRVRDEVGQIALVPARERLFGPGSGPIMAAFTHLNPQGSRFSDGSYGVFYAARHPDTAMAETRHHSARFLAATAEAPLWLQMRLYRVTIGGKVADLRGAARVMPAVLDADDYASSQAVGKRLRADGAAGLVYPSVRHAGGVCLAAFRTTLLRDCLHEAHLEYHWNGEAIDYITRQVA